MRHNEIDIVPYPSALFVACGAFGYRTIGEIFGNAGRGDRERVELRQVIVWFMLREGLSRAGITELTGVKRCMIYYNSRMVDDRLYIGDVTTIGMIDRINRAKMEFSG